MIDAAKVGAARSLLFILEGKWLQVAALAALSATLFGCSALTGASTTEEAIVGGVALGAAAIDWLLANNVLPPDMADDLSQWFNATNEALETAQRGINEVRENSITVEEATYGASGTVAGVMALIRAWRGGASKGPLKAAVDGLKTIAGNATTPKTPPAE